MEPYIEIESLEKPSSIPEETKSKPETLLSSPLEESKEASTENLSEKTNEGTQIPELKEEPPLRAYNPGSYNDIVFIIDSTGSMSSYFPEVKKVINELLAIWGDGPNLFSIVSYTDHHPDNGAFSAENPIKIFPTNKSLNLGDPNDAMDYTETMSTSGGGAQYGEALIDGIAEALMLTFRTGSNKIFVVACDDSPHGKEFLNNTKHPEGCPCGYKWKNLLKIMKERKTHFIFVQLSALLDKTVELFQKEYDGTMIHIKVENVADFAPKVSESAIEAIRKNLRQ